MSSSEAAANPEGDKACEIEDEEEKEVEQLEAEVKDLAEKVIELRRTMKLVFRDKLEALLLAKRPTLPEDKPSSSEAGKCNFQEGGFTENFGDSQSPEYLNLEHNIFYSLPLSITLLFRLTKLILHRCQNLLELPILPQGVIELDVGDCPQLRKVGNLFHLEKLEILIICSCGQLFELVGLSCFKSFKKMNLAGCNNLKGMERVEQLQSLEKLYLNGWPASDNFYCWTKVCDCLISLRKKLFRSINF
ncbi:uncharacterized protein LOC131030732 isoform X1 [Cryptomeria japonica]|uniref:uncharacterized protein LOC131030732 isoform X1 n=1 Tax=Cryptomeria japonica TaxID=3369 RepID=UPI0027DA9F4A|nr:uncharacterized protein LOC131030732 isoform X1 [Cryptomeria japonica]